MFDGDERKLANKCLFYSGLILGISTLFAVFVAGEMDRARARAATMEQIRQNIAQEEAILPDDAEALEIVVPAVGGIPSFRFVCPSALFPTP